MKLTELSVKRPVTTMMTLLSFVVIGYISFTRLPMEFFPAIDVPFIFVYLPYQGSTPEEVEKKITGPAEEVLSMISGIKKIRSNSNQNDANIQLEFNWGEDANIKAMEAREKLDGIKHLLPDDFERFYVFKFNTSDMPVLEIRLSSNKDISNAYDLLERSIKRPLERIPGVADVEMHGVEKKTLKVEVIPDKLISHNIDISKVSATLSRNDFSISNGKLKINDATFMIRSESKLTTPDEIANLRIIGTSLKISDIAKVTYQSPELEYGRHLNGKFAVGLSVKKSSEANAVDVCSRIIRTIDEINQNPEMEGIDVYLMENQGEGIKSSLRELLNSGMVGALFALMVLYVFLRSITNTVIVILSVPFSMLITGVVMYFLDMSLNILSMMGLMLAVGMLVDNAVVAMESIHKHQSEMKDRKSASIVGTGKIALAITAGTATSIIVFLPNIINDDNIVSIYLKFVGLPLVIALTASLIISLTVVPVFTSLFKFEFTYKDSKLINKARNFYLRLLEWFLDHHIASIFIIIGILISVAIPANIVKSGDENAMGTRLNLFFNISGDYKLDKVEADVDKVEKYLLENKNKFEIRDVYTFYNTSYARSTIILHEEDREKSSEEIMEEIKKELPKISLGSPSFEWRSSNQDDNLRVRLTGKSSQVLIELTNDVEKYLSGFSGLVDVKSEATSGEKELHVVIDREKAHKYGFTTSSIASAVSTAMRGFSVSKMRTGDNETDIYLKFDDSELKNIENLKEVPLYNSRGDLYKLNNFAEFRYGRGPGTISRENRETSLGVKIGLKGLSKEDSRNLITYAMEKFKLPDGYKWDFGSSFDNWDNGVQTLQQNLLLALALIYFIMAALFESFLLPISIWSSIIFAIVGVWWAFLLTGTDFSFMGWIGILILVGVVVNNGIVLIEYISHLINEGYSRKDAIMKAGSERFRPILMTAGTTILSMLPLCIAQTQIGGDGPPYYPMARAIAGGLFFSTVVTLLILPSVYIILDDIRKKYYKLVKKALS
ncbi:MAG: efflux RND transporter permease subunit [Candidatus Delongbacteria bacterium]|nr:efflux RND transporter permease subunit [Candidatus Delongbacteria bacterium]MBN2836346.1 efflux RND transporter permease subunit [Candidatus Delongbacteria bacterium]